MYCWIKNSENIKKYHMLGFVHQMLFNSNEEAKQISVFESICEGLRGNSKILLQGDAGAGFHENESFSFKWEK